MRNQPESVLKMILKLVSELLQIIYYTRGLINIQCCFVIHFIVRNNNNNNNNNNIILL